ncbi:hypothetical protein CDO52_25405 [Nocardiopsis gilva YIM 90087]|uniref:DUF320 domain-containing protein n=1 Tax=Nocardiopsis gilva YIM 90087 TaxID=1235441 RepID=A0A223SC84_9ACTN|nr:hypothetical protein [Nocardiopsis gilva]ASU85696.1 hypothetical protein CDO52_25405 [Nocardiopsis gilva YIM 90087]
MKRLVSAGFAAGALMGALFMAAPAHADGSSQTNNNLQVLPIQLCNSNILLGVPIASPQTTGHCTNGPINANVDKHKHHGHHGKHHGYHY